MGQDKLSSRQRDILALIETEGAQYIENLAARAYVTMEKGFVFAALLRYGAQGAELASRWQATIEGAVQRAAA